MSVLKELAVSTIRDPEASGFSTVSKNMCHDYTVPRPTRL
jgi:hypothetical protein